MSCIKVPGVQNDLPSTTMETDRDLLDAVSKHKQLITSANKVFGTQWSHAVTNTTIDFIDYNFGKYYVGCQATVKVQLLHGIYHEDVGYSSIDASTKGLAVEKARLISITNALMKVLLCFTELQDEIRPLISNRNSACNISSIVKTKFVSKRPITPPPHAQSTPKIPKSSTAFERILGRKVVIPDVPATNNGLIVPETEKIDIATEDIADLDIIFEKSNELPGSSTLNAPTSIYTGSTSTTMTEEEIRLERKRKQKEKQEEFKNKMKEKEERERQNQRPDPQRNPKF